jgi:hypothetical protein
VSPASTEGSAPSAASAAALAPCWRGQPGRLEVVYATLSDPATGLGCWVHHELVAPTAGAPTVHGWAAVFRPGAAPVVERLPHVPVDAGADWQAVAGLHLPRLAGAAGELSWDVRYTDDGGAPLWTFPAWAWHRQVLPAAQVVPVASAAFTGKVAVGGDEVELSPGARGAVAHIYGHGNAARWGWLHAELGGGDVLEIVTAVSRRALLDRLPPLAFVQLRLAGRDWPRDPLLAAPRFRTRLGLPDWEVRGTIGRWRLRAQITVPPERAVVLGYNDPDGAGATCTNSEVADAEIVLERRADRWQTAGAWSLKGTAHAEVGSRP